MSDPGILGGGRLPRPLNDPHPSRPHSGLIGPPRGIRVAEADKPRTKAKAAPAASGREVTVYGSFDNPYGGTGKEAVAMKEDRWEPTSDDFADVGGKNSIKVNSYLGVLYVILAEGGKESKAGSISRLNIFTHANADQIALGGTVEPRSGGMKPQVMLTIQGSFSEDTLEGLNKGVTFQVPSSNKSLAAKKFTLADVQSRFTKDAIIVIYACHTGVSRTFLQDFADTFQVKVRGFDDVIGYFPTYDEDPARVTSRTQTGVGHNSPNKVTDFHKLDESNKAVEVKPKPPKSGKTGKADDDDD